MSSDLQRTGGIAALIEAALYVTGFAMFLTVLDPTGYVGHAQKVAFLADNQVASYIANLLIYVVFGVVLVVPYPCLNIATILGLVDIGH